VARNRLKDLGIYNLQDFMLEFAEMKNDWKVKANGEVESAQVMKNFKNLGALQSLITEFIDKVDGEEAGVIRPYKRVHKPELDLTPLQKAIIKAETDRMNGAFRKSNEDNPADTLVAMNNMRMATLSPALIDPKFWGDYEEYEGWHAPKLQDIVKESPKLQFVCDTATQQYKARPTEGQVIYMPRGVEQYNYVKDYLVSQGIPADAVAFMDSSVSLDKKEQITSSFNDPDGKIKIIIGSETIKEGVSLNGNSTTIYNTMLGWNPTETIQVEGRIWRQGNKQGVTHVVYPLMNDSIDSMMYQKYDEKSSRLNALWSYKGDSLNVEDINPEELKFALIKDPEKRAKMRINQQQAELKRNLRMINAEYDNLGTMERELRTAKKGIEEWEGSVDTYSSAYSERKAEYQKAKEDLKAAEKALKKNPDDAELKTEEQRAKIVLSRMEFNLRNIEDALKGAKATLNSHKGTLERLDKQFTRMGVKPEASDAKLKELSAQREMIKQEIDSIEKQRDAYIEQARQDIAAEQAAQRHYTVQDRVDYYTAEIAGDLRPFAGVKSGIQQLRELGKTDIEQVISDIRQSGSARIGDDVFTAKDIRDLESYAKKAVKKSLVMANGRFYICG
jgi:prefoldin subunit 5